MALVDGLVKYRLNPSAKPGKCIAVCIIEGPKEVLSYFSKHITAGILTNAAILYSRRSECKAVGF